MRWSWKRRHGNYWTATVPEGGSASCERQLVPREEGRRGRLLLATQGLLLVCYAAGHEERKTGKFVSTFIITI